MTAMITKRGRLHHTKRRIPGGSDVSWFVAHGGFNEVFHHENKNNRTKEKEKDDSADKQTFPLRPKTSSKKQKVTQECGFSEGMRIPKKPRSAMKRKPSSEYEMLKRRNSYKDGTSDDDLDYDAEILALVKVKERRRAGSSDATISEGSLTERKNSYSIDNSSCSLSMSSSSSSISVLGSDGNSKNRSRSKSKKVSYLCYAFPVVHFNTSLFFLFLLKSL